MITNSFFIENTNVYYVVLWTLTIYNSLNKKAGLFDRRNNKSTYKNGLI